MHDRWSSRADAGVEASNHRQPRCPVAEPGIETRGVEHIRSKILKAQKEFYTEHNNTRNGPEDPIFIIYTIELPKTRKDI